MYLLFLIQNSVQQVYSGNIQIKFTSEGKLAICHELFKWGTSVKIKKIVELRKYYRDYLTNFLRNI